MPLTELMNYFNDQLQVQARTKSLPKTGFYKADNVYWARFGSLILGSEFYAIQSSSSDAVMGFEAELIVRASTGNRLNIDSIFNSLDSNDQIVHLDRLVRTLHSLNYLQQFDGQDQLLSLQVQPRHIVSVTDDHGKAFEAILSDCGLKPERVLLHTRFLDHATLPHFNKALSSYRHHGYKVGVTLTQARDLTHLANLGITPDFIFVQYPAFERAIQAESNTGTNTFFAPVEYFDAVKILVAPDKSVLNLTQTTFNGYLIAPPTDIDSFDSQQQINAL